MKKNRNVIQNILISAGENKLKLCDIVYDSKIIEVNQKTETLFDLSDLANIENRNAILQNYVNEGEENNFMLAIPGAIDSHVHFNTPGFEFRDDFEHGSKSAACGGVTTIIDMPCTSIPPVTSLENLNAKLNALKGRSLIDYAFWGGISGRNFNEAELEKNIFELAEAGVAGFKVYFISGMESFTDLTEKQMEIAARFIERTRKPMAVHAEDKELITVREEKFKNANRNDWKAYCESRDARSEAIAIDKLISIARMVNCKIHVVHLSSKLGLEQIIKAQSEKLFLTTETCPHYLYFTQKDFENQNIKNFLKTAPPVRCEKDKDALWEGLNNNSIQFVVTDHAGCNPSVDKSSKNFWEVYGGIPGVEHRVPFLFSEGFLKGKLNLELTINLLSSNISEYFQINNKGKLIPGNDADFCLIDLWSSQIITSNKMNSKGKYTPFEGLTLEAIVTQTYLRGKKIFDVNEQLIDDYSYGTFLKLN
jgi:allantoinase